MNKEKKLHDQESFFETRDAGEASLLKSLGAKYVGSKIKENDVWFVFRYKEKCEETIRGYLNGAFPEVEAFINAQREIKKIIVNLTRK